MKKTFAGIALASLSVLPAFGADGVVVSTDAYIWKGDTLYQGEFKAWAESPESIRSTYHGRPGYFMPVEQTWTRKNDLSAYPRFKTSQGLLQAVYNMGLDEMINAVEPDTTLRTGKEWAGVWTRDVSYSIILSMAALQPEASMISLMKKVNQEGQIIQDTGSGGAWPVSTDRMIWVVAAWEIYKVTGDRAWLEKVYPIAVRSLAKDKESVMSEKGLVKGETSFIDWREQSYPKWMQTVDISQSEAMGTNMLYCAALKCVSEMAAVLGDKKAAAAWQADAEKLADAIDKTFWMPEQGLHGMYTYGYDNRMLNPRSEALGEALGVLYEITPAEKVKSVSENMPQTPFGTAVFFPQIADMPNYHNNALWPFVGSYWTLAQAKAGNEAGVLEGFGSVVRPAALFATNKENFNLDNGDYFTELNSSNMLWSLSGNLALTQRILFGMEFEKDGLRIAPFVPQTLADTRTLENFPYRGARLNITVEGFGAKVASLSLNGKRLDPDKTIPASMLRKGGDIVVKMDNEPIPEMSLRRTANVKAPLTPVARLEQAPDGSGSLLVWNPIEYIKEYIILRDGEVEARTRSTEWPATEEGVWQVIGVSGDGVQSFASQPLSTRKELHVQLPNETDRSISAEISYIPQKAIYGFRGKGFVETDHSSKPISVVVNVPEEGIYDIQVRYANGNGPVNTENKCAIRSLQVDGRDVGTIVMPQRGVGNWYDWGLSNTVRARLQKGDNTLTLSFGPEDENMNLSTNHALVDEFIVTLAR